MKKSIAKIALLVAVVMLIGVVAGCTTETPEETTAATTQGATTAATTMGEDSNFNPAGQLPIVKETETLRVLLPQSIHVTSYEYGENLFTTYLQDRTNVEIDFIMYPDADAQTKLNIELSTNGDLGDLILMKNYLKESTLMTYGGQGVLMDLTDLMASHAPVMTAAMDEGDFWGAFTAPDGKIYSFPKGERVGIFPNVYAMRFWLLTEFKDAYNAATGNTGSPETTDEYYAYAKWCVDNDANGNGEKDEIGVTGAAGRQAWYSRLTDFLMNSFVLQDKDGYSQRDDIIKAAFVQDGYREGLKFLNNMFNDGLIDINYATDNENSLKSTVALNDGRTVASVAAGGLHTIATDHAIRNDYEILAPLMGPDGIQNSYYSHYESLPGTGGVAIPTSGTAPELATAWIDSCFDLDVGLEGRYGKKGVDWEVPPEGTIAVDGGPAIYRDINNQWNVPTLSHWHVGSPVLLPSLGSQTSEPQPEFNEDGSEIHDLELSLYDAARVYENYVTPCALPPFFFDLDTATKANEWKSNIDDLYLASVTEFIYGTRDINDDAAWATYIAELEDAGLTEYVETMQAEYDRAWKGTMDPVYTKFPQRT